MLSNMKNKVSAYVPSFNNEETIKDAVRSLQNQSIPPREIYVVDDGSSDKTALMAAQTGVEVIQNSTNMGRGFTRAKAVRRAKYELILCCDATNVLEPDFINKTLPFFEDPKVASISGHMRSAKVEGVVGRWRARHLFKEDIQPGPPTPTTMLITYGTLMRTAPILEVGNFNPSLLHTEDNELGLRLHSAGYKILGSPDAVVRSIASPTLWKTFERYWRWHVGIDEKFSFRQYLHTVKASIKPMAQKDLERGDWYAAMLSLLCPHYCLLKSLTRKVLQKGNQVGI